VRTGKPLRGLRILPRAGGGNPLEKASRKRAAVCGFNRARRELGYKETEFHSVGTCRLGSGGATKVAREAAHPPERGTRGTDVRSPVPSTSLRAMGSSPVRAETATRVRCAKRIEPGPSGTRPK
jgi:hypothetical protein